MHAAPGPWQAGRWPAWPGPKETLEAIKKTIPAEYLEEIEGLVEGHNRQLGIDNGSNFSLLTVDDVLLLNLLPDSRHFNPLRTDLVPACERRSTAFHPAHTH